jgi:hypothetical protein
MEYPDLRRPCHGFHRLNGESFSGTVGRSLNLIGSCADGTPLEAAEHLTGNRGTHSQHLMMLPHRATGSNHISIFVPGCKTG